METKLKQRVIGALVITALLIIFLPAFFKGSSTSQPSVSMSEQIPSPPPKPTVSSISNTTNEPQIVESASSNQTVITETPTNNNAAPIKDVFQPSTEITSSQNNSVTESQQVQDKTPQKATKPITQADHSIVTSQNQPGAINKPLAPNENRIMGSGEPYPQNQVKSNKQISDELAIATEVSSVEKKVLVENKVASNTNNKVPAVTTDKALAPAEEKKPVTAKVIKKSTGSSAPTESIATASVTTPVPPQPVAAATPVTPPVATAAQEKPHTAKGSAWVVQLGSFSDPANAKQLVQQLQGHGFVAYQQKVKSTKGNMTRVLVGPETQRTKAVAILDKLDKVMRLKGVIIAYAPV